MKEKEELPEGFRKISEGKYEDSNGNYFYSIKSFKEEYTDMTEGLSEPTNTFQNKLESNEPLLRDSVEIDDKILIYFSESTTVDEGWAYREEMLIDFYKSKDCKFPF